MRMMITMINTKDDNDDDNYINVEEEDDCCNSHADEDTKEDDTHSLLLSYSRLKYIFTSMLTIVYEQAATLCGHALD